MFVTQHANKPIVTSGKAKLKPTHSIGIDSFCQTHTSTLHEADAQEVVVRGP